MTTAPRHLRVILVVDVAILDVLPPHLPPVTDDENAGRLVESIALRSARSIGRALEPVSRGCSGIRAAARGPR